MQECCRSNDPHSYPAGAVESHEMNLGEGTKFLQVIPAKTFRQLCLRHEVYKQSRSFEPWDHRSCLVLSQVLDLKSLRDV